jgi:hypothetical protein
LIQHITDQFDEMQGGGVPNPSKVVADGVTVGVNIIDHPEHAMRCVERRLHFMTEHTQKVRFVSPDYLCGGGDRIIG